MWANQVLWVYKYYIQYQVLFEFKDRLKVVSMLQPLIYWYNKSQQLPANSILHVASLCPRSYSTFLSHSRHSFFTGHHRHETPRHQLLQRRTCRDRQHVGNIWIWRDFWNDVLLEQKNIKNIKNIMYLISTLMYVILQHLDVLKYIEIGIIIQRKSSIQTCLTEIISKSPSMFCKTC